MFSCEFLIAHGAYLVQKINGIFVLCEGQILLG